MSIFDKFGNSPGIKKGLAYKHDWSQDMNSLMQVREYKDRKKLEDEQWAMWIAERQKIPYSSNKYGQSLIEANSNKVIGQMNKMREENPDFNSDPKLLGEYMRLSDSLINNPIVAGLEEVKNNYAQLQADDESSLEHKDEYFKMYDEWANKAYDEKSGIDPLDDLTINNGIWKYKKESQFKFTDVVDIYRNILQYNEETPIEKGNYMYVKKTVSNEAIDQAVTEIIGNDKYYKTAVVSFKELIENLPEGTVQPYSDVNQFIEASLRRSKSPMELLHEKTTRAKAEEKEYIDKYTYGKVPLKINKLIAQIKQQGSVEDGPALLGLTSASKVGGRFSLITSGARTMGKTPGKSFEKIGGAGSEILDFAEAKGATRITYYAPTGEYVVEAQVTINAPKEGSTEFNDQLTNLGFVEDKNYYSNLAAITGEDEAYFDQGTRPKKLTGWVMLPADPSDPNKRWNYERYYSKSPKTAEALDYRELELDQQVSETLDFLKNNSVQNNAKSTKTTTDQPVIEKGSLDNLGL